MKSRCTNEADVNIGKRIRAARIAAGMSQEALGHSIGLTFQQVQKYEKGTNRIGGSRMIQIAGVLKTRVSDLFGEDANDSPATLSILATREGQELLEAFSVISSLADRKLVVALAQRLSQADRIT